MPKVFIRSSDLTRERPIIAASYQDDYPIPDDAHGEGMTIMTLPHSVLGGPSKDSLGLPSLLPGWRERAGDIPVKAEAKRRITEAFSISDQLNALFDMVDAILKYGTDQNKWPADIAQRKRAYDEARKYIAEVMEKARVHVGVMPRDPSKDNAWPPRLKKHV
jgi:hypothetical protein